MFLYILVHCRRFYETTASDGPIVHPRGDRLVTMENCWRETDKGNSKWETCSRTIFFGTIFTYS